MMDAAENVQFVAAYGTLRDPESVAKTLGNAARASFYAQLEGFSLEFNVPIEEVHVSALGIVAAEGSFVEVSLVEVSQDELLLLDKRETGAYQRVEVPKMSLSFCEAYMPETTRVWIYKPTAPSPASADFPVILSDLDVMLRARYRIDGERGMVQFLRSVRGLEMLINDRAKPLYPRALDYSDPQNLQLIDKIDNLLDRLIHTPEAKKKAQ